MRMKRSEIADEIMRDYYRQLLWKERIKNMQELKELRERLKKENISDAR